MPRNELLKTPPGSGRLKTPPGSGLLKTPSTREFMVFSPGRNRASFSTLPPANSKTVFSARRCAARPAAFPSLLATPGRPRRAAARCDPGRAEPRRAEPRAEPSRAEPSRAEPSRASSSAVFVRFCLRPLLSSSTSVFVHFCLRPLLSSSAAARRPVFFTPGDPCRPRRGAALPPKTQIHAYPCGAR